MVAPITPSPIIYTSRRCRSKGNNPPEVFVVDVETGLKFGNVVRNFNRSGKLLTIFVVAMVSPRRSIGITEEKRDDEAPDGACDVKILAPLVHFKGNFLP
mmetsp:Transcript_45813/g.51073  ORF Transcript_45813/g.51073 Transcript_45813/m.51073 type:complete len:100 (+) Transcript_45813:73-372(+)